MPPKITHEDGFEIWLSHQDEYLIIYDSVGTSDNSQGEAPSTTAHKGTFAGVRNKATVQRKTGTEPLMIQLFIVREFNFFAGNAVEFGLHVVTTDGDKEQPQLDAILKKTHDKKPKDPTGFPWIALQGSEAPKGAVFVSVTRGTSDEVTGLFTALSGKGDEPYIVEVGWRSIEDSTRRRVTRGMQNAFSTPPPVSRKRPAKPTKPKATKSVEQSGGSSSAEGSMEPTGADTSSEQVPPGDKNNNTQPSVEPTVDSQTQAAGDVDSTEDPFLPIRLRDGINLPQSEDAPGSDGAEVFATPPATSIHSDRTPDLDSGTGGVPEGSVIGSTPTLAHETDVVGPGTPDLNPGIGVSQRSVIGSTPTLAHETNDTGTTSLKRSAGDAFESDREKDLIRLAFEVDMAKADLGVDDAKVQEMTDESSPGYFNLLLKKAKSLHGVVDAELELKRTELEGKKDAKYRELKTRKAEAHLAVLEAQESAGALKNRLAFNVEMAQAQLKVAQAKVKQMVHAGREGDDVVYLQAVLSRAQANSGVALAEFELKAAECGDDKDAEYFRLQTRKAEAHRGAIRAKGVLLKAELQR